jgi:hypothetical protein
MIWSMLSHPDEERGFAAVLVALARELADAEAAQVEMHAPARRDMADVKAEEHQLAEEEAAAARRRAEAFRSAVIDARRRSAPDGAGEAGYDSGNPEENAMADLLIRYLVRTDYAEVRTEDVAPGRHRYYIRVDWPRLRNLAENAGHELSV